MLSRAANLHQNDDGPLELFFYRADLSLVEMLHWGLKRAVAKETMSETDAAIQKTLTSAYCC